MPIRTTRSFLAEQESLRAPVEHLLLEAADLPEMTLDERIDVVERAVAFLTETLTPHTQAHERVVYPVLERRFGRGEAAASAHDRELIRARINDLVAADPADVERLQELLYALHLLATGSLDKESEAYMRLLETAPAGGIERLLDRVERYERALAAVGPG